MTNLDLASAARALGIFFGVAMPFFNIPLVRRIVKRRSSEDISLTWVIGVWVCIVGMVPASLVSSDPVLYIFGIVNAVFFSAVLLAVLYFHPLVRRSRSH